MREPDFVSEFARPRTHFHYGVRVNFILFGYLKISLTFSLESLALTPLKYSSYSSICIRANARGKYRAESDWERENQRHGIYIAAQIQAMFVLIST